MYNVKKFLLLILRIFLLALIAASCRFSRIGSVSVPDSDEAVVIFLSGTVNILEKDNWRPVLIGESLKSSAVIQVLSDSYCEIQLGVKALIRVEENSILQFDSLFDKKNGTDIDLGLQKGIILCKVEKVLDNEKFQVRTPTATIGVRGTRFLVETDASEATVLAVREGAVRIQPDIGLDELKTQSNSDDVSGYITGLEESFPVVMSGEEVIIDRNEARSAQTAYKDIKALLESEKPRDDKFFEDIKDAGRNLESFGIKGEVSAENERLLDRTDGMEILTPEENPELTRIIVSGPDGCDIYLKNRYAGKNEFQGILPLNVPVPLTVKKPGYYTLETVVTPENPNRNEFSFNLDKIPDKTYSITTIPATASITVNGSSEGSGFYEGILKDGENAVVRASAPGYNDKWLIIYFDENSREDVTVELDRSIIKSYKPSASKIIGLAAYNGTVIYSDYDGYLCAVKGTRNKLWTVSTVNTPIEASIPVLMDNLVAFSGLNELVLINANTGGIVFRKTLSQSEQHIFGRHPVEFGGMIAYPTNSGFQLLRKNGEKIKDITIPDGTRMTPAVNNENLYLADQNGVVYIFNSKGENTGTIDTSAERPIALSLTIQGNYGYFADKNGRVVCLDLDRKNVIWERNIERNVNIPVSDNLVVSGERIYIFSRGILYTLSSRDGSPVYSTADEFSAPPLYIDGLLYIGGEDGKLHILRSDSGKEMFSVDLKEKITTVPVYADNRIYVGTERGNIFEIKPLEIPAVVFQ